MSRDVKEGHRGRGDGGRGPRNTHDDVQRAIEGLKEIPDDELQEFLDDEDFNIVDTWEGDEDNPEDGGGRNGRERDARRHSRDRNRRDRRRPSPRDHRDRARRDERRREEVRRDPSKSSKDIERDKIRIKRDNDSKILAEKEKAIKHLLDSDTVVPPGTEAEAIETERLNMDRGHRRSRERRRTPDRHRISPPRRRSHEKTRFSPLHRDKSPFHVSPDRRRSLERRRSSERRRRGSWDRRASAERRERRASAERHRRRGEERDLRVVVRRSRSRERHRSRSADRTKRRWSRSPGHRGGSPRRRNLSKSPDRRRKRSPFINEIARQFRDEALISSTTTVNPFIQQQPLINAPLLPGPPAPSQHYMPMMDPVNQMGMPAPTSAPAPFMPFEALPPPAPINFDPVPMHPLPHEYNAPPVMYNQGMAPQDRPPFSPLPVPAPQPVPAPIPMETSLYNPTAGPNLQRSPSPIRSKFPDPGHYERERERERERDRNRGSAYNGGSHLSRTDRLKTPEPPVISDPKPFEKTSLSSLLEASVSAKDSGYPVLYPGFKPELLRNCEMALRNLPDEDPRLKMPGRFFFDPTKEEPRIEKQEFVSNSILLQKTRNKIIWKEEKAKVPVKPDMYQKYTQTETGMEEKCTQTVNETEDFCVQVCPGDLQPSPPPVREEKRPIMDRLDWSVRETYDYTPAARDAADLRWSLSNNRPWNRISPPLPDRENRTRSPERMHQDRDTRAFDISPVRSRDKFSIQSNRSNNFRGSRDRFSPSFRRSMDHQDDYAENRSEHSRGESPGGLDDGDEVEILEEESFTRESSWRGRGKSFGPASKPRVSRGKYTPGRPFRGRSSGFRGKF